MSNESYLDQITTWWKENKNAVAFVVRLVTDDCKDYLKQHEEVIKGIGIGLKIANDLDTFRRFRTALKEGDTKKAAWCAFVLGLALANYLHALQDFLERGEDDDGQDGDDGDDTLPGGPSGRRTISKEAIDNLMKVFMQTKPTFTPVSEDLQEPSRPTHLR